MDNNNQNQFVDDLLDAGLTRYSNVAPRPGLEGRIVANAHAAEDRRSWFVWAGRLAFGGLAAILVVGVVTLMRLRVPPPPRVPSAAASALQSVPRPLPAPSMRSPRALHRRPLLLAHRPVLPASKPAVREARMPQFPSPQPPTEQERLLAQYVRITPAEALSASRSDDTEIEAIQIKELNIAPLENDGSETNNNQ